MTIYFLKPRYVAQGGRKQPSSGQQKSVGVAIVILYATG